MKLELQIIFKCKCMNNNKPILRLETAKGIFWGFSKRHANGVIIPNRVFINGMSIKVNKLYSSHWISGYGCKFFKSYKNKPQPCQQNQK